MYIFFCRAHHWDWCTKEPLSTRDWELLILNEKYLTFFETIPFPIGDYMNEFGNILLLNELNFDTNKMKVSYEEHIIKLNQD